MLLNNGNQFITRSAFNLRMKETGAPEEHTFENYLADSLELGSYKESDIIDALISIIDEAQGN